MSATLNTAFSAPPHPTSHSSQTFTFNAELKSQNSCRTWRFSRDMCTTMSCSCLLHWQDFKCEIRQVTFSLLHCTRSPICVPAPSFLSLTCGHILLTHHCDRLPRLRRASQTGARILSVTITSLFMVPRNNLEGMPAPFPIWNSLYSSACSNPTYSSRQKLALNVHPCQEAFL